MSRGIPLLENQETEVWKLAEEVAEEVWKLLLTHCPCLRPGGWDIPLPGQEGWSLGFFLLVIDKPGLPGLAQFFGPSLLDCQFEVCHGISLPFS